MTLSPLALFCLGFISGAFIMALLSIALDNLLDPQDELGKEGD